MYNNYGVLMNGLETMKFELYTSGLSFGMNTLTKTQRFVVADRWIKKHRNNKSVG